MASFVFWLVMVMCLHQASVMSVTDARGSAPLPPPGGPRAPTDGNTADANGAGGMIQAFVIPHSHMDVGWIYTVKESMVAYAANVYTTVVDNLMKDPKRRFIAVEQEFFRLWWTTVATDTQKKQTHQLVQSGQLEFIIGGQVMHDEAVTEYSATIQQMTEGHAFIYETFGKRPQFSWHVDPFGASSATPTLFALMGFNAHLTSRIDYDVKAQMQKTKGLQFVWRASPSLGVDQQIFTHVMDQFSYCTPPTLPFSNKTGFYWNGYAVFPKPPDGIYPDMSLPVTDANIKEYALTMVNNMKQRAAWFRTPQLLWPWGCDKQFFNSTLQFENMDKLMMYINKNSKSLGVHVQYATLGEYFKAIHQTKTTWALKTQGDFLSYSSAPNAAWTGFYTSRAGLKGIARRAQSTLHAGETLFSVYLNQPGINRTVNSTDVLDSLKDLRWASAEVQHHDGITGTESVKVKGMFEDHLQTAETKTLASMKNMFKDLIKGTGKGDEGQDLLTFMDPGQIVDVSPDKPLLPVLVYNPLGWSVKRLVQMNIKDPKVTVIDIHGRDIGSQVNPPLTPGGPYHLFFYAQLVPMNYDVYYIKYKSQNKDGNNLGKIESLKPVKLGSVSKDKAATKSISNDCFEVIYDATTNMLKSITDKQTKKNIQMEQVFMEYYAHSNVMFGQASSLYMFRPWGTAHPVGYTVKLDIVTGPYVNETRQSIYNFYSPNQTELIVTLRIFDLPHGHNDDVVCGHIELDFKVGPLTPNKELIYRFSTKLATGGVLYTNDNGFQTIKRPFRPKMPEPVAQNYYPLVSSAYIQSVKSDVRLTVLAERSHGVGSLTSGQMEVMLLRRLITNSGYADKNNLTLEEAKIVTPTLWLLLSNHTLSSELQRRAWLQLENPPVIMAIKTKGPWLNLWKSNKSGRIPNTAEFLKLWKHSFVSTPLPTVFTDLPHNVHLLTLKTPGWTYNASHQGHAQAIRARVKQGKYDTLRDTPNLNRLLLRLQHLYEKDEHPKLSLPVTIDLAKYLSPFGTIASVSERSLTAIWPASQVKRWTWLVKDSSAMKQGASSTKVTADSVAAVNITLNPQEIKTFLITFKKSA